jgi:alcohol dehydrogenase class IV
MNFDFTLPGNVLFGLGRIKELPARAKNTGKKAFIVTSFPEDFEILVGILKLLDENGIGYEVFNEVKPNPRCTLVDRTAKIFLKKGCDYLIGLGGGSSIDFAKAIAVRAAHSKDIWNYVFLDYRDALEITGSTLPIIAIPTTAGTGSEVTKWAVLTNPETYEKSFLGSNYIIPKIAIVDPELTKTLPPGLTASTGVDVLSHSIESYINLDATYFSELHAKEAMRIIARYLPEAVANGKNLIAREQVSWASTLAGIAITHVGTTLIHCIGHVIGGRAGVDHGVALAVCLEPVMEYSWTSNIEKFAVITGLMGENISGMTLKESAEFSSNAIKKFMQDINLDIKLTDLGIKKNMIDQLVDDIFKYTKCMLDVHPKIFNREEIKNILLLAL